MRNDEETREFIATNVKVLLLVLKDYDAMADNLKATQARCTELIQELRDTKRRLSELLDNAVGGP